MKTQLIPLVVFGLMIPCQAGADNPKDTVDVRAVGEVTVPSDMVVLPISVATGQSDVGEVKKRNDQVTTQIYQLAESQRVCRPTLTNTTLSFHFEERPLGNGGKEAQKQMAPLLPRKGGSTLTWKGGKGGGKGNLPDEEEYHEPPIQMSRQLLVRFDDLNQAITFVAEVVKWESVTTGELTLSPLSFGVTDPHRHLLEARRRAVASAIEKAKLLAELNGLKLGNATQIYDESSDNIGGPERPAEALRIPLAPGAAVIDPFALPPGIGIGHFPSSPPPGPAATRKEGPHEKLDLDRVAPAQVTITASVRIVFDIRKP
jgi:uncharacterized protein YggE